MQKNAQPHIYRTAEYYGVNDDGKYQIIDQLGYVWTLEDVKINTTDNYLIKVNLGEIYDSKEDDVLEQLWVKIQ